MNEQKKVKVHLKHGRNLWVGKENKFHKPGPHELSEEALAHPYAQALIKEGVLSLGSPEAQVAASKGADEAVKKLKAAHDELGAKHKAQSDELAKLQKAHDELKAEHELFKKDNEELQKQNAAMKKKLDK